MKSLGDIERIALSVSGWLTPHEGKFLYKAAKLLKNHKGTIVEIGSYCGKSTLYLAAGGEHVYAVDPHKGNVSGGNMKPTYDIFLKNIRKAKLQHSVHPIVKTSRSACRGWTKPIKMLFIDGLHDALHAKEDYTLWSRHLVDGGIIAMHDAFCAWEGAGDVAIKNIVQNDQYREIGVIGSIIYGIRGKPKGIQFILVHRLLRLLLINRFTSL